MSGAAIYQTLKEVFEDPIRPDLAVRNVGQATVVLALVAWPVMLHFRSKRPWALYPIGFAVLGAAYLLGQLAPAAAFFAGGAAAGLVILLGPWGARLTGALLALQIFATPWLVLAGLHSGLFERLRPFLPRSWEARLDIWSYAATRVLQQPELGWGLDASRRIGAPVSLHTHNGALQIWLELGVVGAALFALVWTMVFEAVARTAPQDRVGAAVCAGAAGAYFTIGALSFGVWQEWWLALAALTAGVCFALLQTRARERMAEPPRALRTGELTPL
jgi:O-antigen ligase